MNKAVEHVDFEFVVTGVTAPGGGHCVRVQARLRDGTLHPVSQTLFRGGCPPASLDLIASAADDYVQQCLLTCYGLQGDLFEG